MATFSIKALWCKLTGKDSTQSTYFLGDRSRGPHTTVLYDREGQKMVSSAGQPDVVVEFAMTATGSAVPILDLFGERAQAEIEASALKSVVKGERSDK